MQSDLFKHSVSQHQTTDGLTIRCGVAASYGGDFGGLSTPAGCAVGSAAAGLVQYKTTPNQNNPYPPLQRQKHTISFSKCDVQLRRIKRLKRNTYLAGQLHSLPQPGFRPMQAWLITHTYDTKGTLGRGCHNWHPDHMTRSTDAYRRWCKSKGYLCKYTWVGELQASGTVHYHLVAWLTVRTSMPHWDRKDGKRKPFWPHGMTKTEKLKTNCSYLMKYLSKMGEFHEFPHGMRLSGNGGLDSCARAIRAWHSLPTWARTLYGVGDVKRTHFGIVDLSTGEVLPPMYRRKLIPGGLELHLIGELPERWQSAPGEYFGPYSSIRQPGHNQTD